MKNITARTRRLVMRPQGMDEIRELYRKEADAEMKKAYSDMLETMKELPGQEEWGSDWKICLDNGDVIGGICFKGAPNDLGTVEIGYGIEELTRNKAMLRKQSKES